MAKKVQVLGANICKASNHITSILDACLSNSKNEYFNRTVKETFDLSLVFTEIAVLLAYLVQDEVTFSTHIELPSKIWILGDATVWKQLLVRSCVVYGVYFFPAML